MSTQKPKFVFMTTLAFVIVMVAAVNLRSGLTERFQVLGWGFVMIFGSIYFVRGIYAINRLNRGKK